jgi:hypothetical protein
MIDVTLGEYRAIQRDLKQLERAAAPKRPSRG